MSTKKEKKQKKKKNVRSESNPESITKDVEIESESSLSKITQKASKKRKNESESESFLGETEQKTSQKQTSQKRKKFEGESEPLPRRSERIASQESELASAVRDLGLSSTLSSGYGAEDLPSTFISDYDVEDLPSSASKFKIEDMKALKVNFIGASAEKKVIPNIEATIPEKYVLPKIDSEMLGNSKFNVEKIDGLDEEVQTFVAKLHDVVLNGAQVVGTDETFTDTLVDDLLRITKLNNWPLRIRNHPLCKLYIKDDPYVSSDPEFVIKMRDLAILVVEDKHLKNVGYATNFGESQIAVEILACCSENIRSLGSSPTNQTLWAIRIITSYVTFYKTTIPVKYWEDLAKGLPKEKVVVQRWPAANGLLTGFDLATSEGRRTVLTGLAKIREFLKQHSTSSTAVASQSTSSPAVASQSTSSPAVAPQSTSSPAVASQGKIEVSSRKDKQKASEN